MLRALSLLLLLLCVGVRGDTECAPQRSLTRLMRGSFAPGVLNNAPGTSLVDTPYEYGSTFEAGTATHLSYLFVRSASATPTVWTVWSGAGVLLTNVTHTSVTTSLSSIPLDPPVALEPGARFTVSASGAGRTQATVASASPNEQVFDPTVASLATYLGSFRGAVGMAPQDALADPLTVLAIDVGLYGCVVQPTVDAPSGRATLRVDAVTYPPGVCGFTHACRVDRSAYVGPVGEVCTAPESACDFVDPESACRQEMGFNVTRQLTCACTHPCLTGPLCTTLVKPLAPTRAAGAVQGCYADNAIFAPCRTFGPLGCNSTALTCVRQTFAGTRQVAGIALPAMDVCCPRGFVGDACDVPVGCTVSGCDHNGTCLAIDSGGRALLPKDTRCFGCDVGFGGVFCQTA
ncbi:MAG: hypothetical protein Q7V62_09465, partial [Actinomycetota bacterium]|nr:hypothetical protein [Actinomycetota bacterium]